MLDIMRSSVETVSPAMRPQFTEVCGRTRMDYDVISKLTEAYLRQPHMPAPASARTMGGMR